MKIKKYHNKILKHMNTFGVTIYHILIHCIGSKLGLYISFRIPLYVYCKKSLRKNATCQRTIAMAIQRDNSSCVLETVVSRWGLLHVTHTIQIQLIYFLNNASNVAVHRQLTFLKVFWKYVPVLELS